MKFKFCLFFVLIFLGRAETLDKKVVDKIVNSIYKLEGGDGARVPHGILSVKVKDKNEARQVCVNTVNRNFQRWQKAGQPGRFLDYLGNAYCPKSCDPIGNRNWLVNIKMGRRKGNRRRLGIVARGVRSGL